MVCFYPLGGEESNESIPVDSSNSCFNDEEIIRLFFLYLHKEILCSDLNRRTTVTKLLYRINGIGCWMISTGDGVLEMMESEAAVLISDCSVSAESNILAAVFRGQTKMLTAYMLGNLKVQGDKKAFLVFTSVFNKAVSMVASDILSKGAKYDFSIVGSEQSVDGSGHEFTKYYVKIVDKSDNYSWRISRRYSDFEVLRNRLVSEGHDTLPPVPDRTYPLLTLLWIQLWSKNAKSHLFLFCASYAPL